jgi:hypothetical protein
MDGPLENLHALCLTNLDPTLILWKHLLLETNHADNAMATLLVSMETATLLVSCMATLLVSLTTLL